MKKLLKKSSVTPKQSSKVTELQEEIKKVEAIISTNQEILDNLYIQLFEEHVSPIKVGEEAMCLIHIGKTNNYYRSILSVVGSTVYATPYKKDGTLSDKRYIMFSISSSIPTNIGEIIKPLEK